MIEGLIQALRGYLESGSLLAYPIVFLGGILVSFTPCVYPIIPITVAYIGAQSGGSKLKGLSLSIFYVLGLAITYAVLGIIASLTGQFFGQIQSSPWTKFFIANVCLLLGLAMLDVFNLPLPHLLARLAPRTQKKGFLGAFLVGMASGLVVGPCTAPALGVLLAYVAAKQNVVFGASLMFVFALGMSLLLIVIGTFTGLLTALPKAGEWTIKIKKIFGWILIFVAEYFLVEMGKMLI